MSPWTPVIGLCVKVIWKPFSCSQISPFCTSGHHCGLMGRFYVLLRSGVGRAHQGERRCTTSNDDRLHRCWLGSSVVFNYGALLIPLCIAAYTVQQIVQFQCRLRLGGVFAIW